MMRSQPPSQSVDSSEPGGLEFQVAMDPTGNESRLDKTQPSKKKKKKKKKKVESVASPTDDDLQAQIDEERIRQEQEQLAEHQRKMELLAQKQKEYAEIRQ